MATEDVKRALKAEAAVSDVLANDKRLWEGDERALTEALAVLRRIAH